MSVIGQAEEIPNGQAGGVSAENGNFTTTHTRVFQVHVSSPLDSEIGVIKAPGLPFLYAPFVSISGGVDLFALATGFSVTRVAGTRLLWHVTVSYSHFDSEQKDDMKSPVVRRPRVSWDTEEFQRPLLLAHEDKRLEPRKRGKREWMEEVVVGVVNTRYANSAGEVFSPPPMETVYREVVTFNYGSPFFDNDIAIKFTGAVNTDLFFGRPKFTAKVRKIRTPGVTAWTGQNNVEVLYFPITVVIAFAEDDETWSRSHLDFGSYWRDDDGIKHNITDGAGNPIQGRLDGEGKELADDKPDKFITLYQSIGLPFSKLALPGSQPGGVGGA